MILFPFSLLSPAPARTRIPWRTVPDFDHTLVLAGATTFRVGVIVEHREA